MRTTEWRHSRIATGASPLSKPSTLEYWEKPLARSGWINHPNPTASHLDFLSIFEQPELIPISHRPIGK